MQKIKSTKLLTVLLLVGVCGLGCIMIKNVIGLGLDVDYDIVGFNGPNAFEYHEDHLDEDTLTASISVSGNLYEEDGDDEGDGLDPVSWVYAGGSAYVDENQNLLVSLWAQSGIAYERQDELIGRANAWVKFPAKD